MYTMQVKVLRDCFAGKYYTEGTEDDYEGPPNRHLEPIDKAEKAKWEKAIAKAEADRNPKPATEAPAAAPPKPADRNPKPATEAPAAAPPKPAEPVDLTKMTKAEIVEHAAEVHGLELDHTATKDELIEQVKEAEKNG